MSTCFCLTRKTPASSTIQLPFPAVNLQEGSLGSPPSAVAPSCCGLHVVFVVGDSHDTVHPPGCFTSDCSQLLLAVLIMCPERCIELVFPLSSRVLQHPRWICKLSFPMTHTYCFLPASTASTPCTPIWTSQRAAHRSGYAAGLRPPACCWSYMVEEKSDPCPSRSWCPETESDGHLLFAPCHDSCCPLSHQTWAVLFCSYCCGFQKVAVAPLQFPALHSSASTFSLFHTSAILVFSGLQVHQAKKREIFIRKGRAACNCGLPTSHSKTQMWACKLNDKELGCSKDKAGWN